MITYAGFDELIARVYAHRQDHVFEYWGELIDAERRELLNDLTGIDFEGLQSLFAQTRRSDAVAGEFGPAPFIPIPKTEGENAQRAQAREAGIAHIRARKVAAFLVAGGQGTRLGYDGPKGKFPVSPVAGKTLFQIHAEKVLASSRAYGVDIPWLIMTSIANHEETETFLEEHDYFGIRETLVHVFPQNLIPSLDANGSLILESKNRIFKNPDGHGGSLTALKTSGALDFLAEHGIDTLSYFQVDNPLVRVIDPDFIGYHVLNTADVSSKAVTKAGPEEKVGVFVRFPNGACGVVEYSDMTHEQQHLQDCTGALVYAMGNIAIHLFSVEYIRRLTAGGAIELPYHVARKKIKSLRAGAPAEIDGFKFEKFVFDAIPLAERSIVFETSRDEEFAPVKNRTGVDSVDTAREMMSALFRSWLAARGVSVPPGVRAIEISPLLALGPDDLPADLTVPDRPDVYLS